MSLNIRPLSEPLAKVAREELNEVPSRLADDVRALKEWIAKQPHLCARTDDQFLVNYLRGSKHSLERVKEKLDLAYSIRSAMPGLFTNEDPLSPKHLELIRAGTMLPLLKTATPDGPRIVLARFAADPNKYEIMDLMWIQTYINMICMMEDDNMIVAGQKGIIDLKGASMAHFTQFSPGLMKKMALMSQDANPLRMKGFHYINVPSFFESIFNFFKTFLNAKMKSRLYVHGENLDALYKDIPKDLLPIEYGGTSGTLQELIDHWEKKVVEYRDFLMEEVNFKTDESKRQAPTKYADSLFGVEGSFRKLDVD